MAEKRFENLLNAVLSGDYAKVDRVLEESEFAIFCMRRMSDAAPSPAGSQAIWLFVWYLSHPNVSRNRCSMADLVENNAPAEINKGLDAAPILGLVRERQVTLDSAG